jgi:hypothetical protein
LVLEEAPDECIVSFKLGRIRWRFKDDDHPLIADEERGTTKNVSAAATAVDAGV